MSPTTATLKQPSILSVMFPPSPPLKSLPSPITGRVVIITGAASGMGFELAKILYLAGATIYIGARSSARCDGAKKGILSSTRTKGQSPKEGSLGKLENMVMDLADLASVKAAVGMFLAKEQRLDLLMHNAGVMTPPKGSVDEFGRDLELSTNCLGPFLLTSLLSPILSRTAASAPKDSVRVVFVTSLLHASTPTPMMEFDKSGVPTVMPKAMDNYMQSKIGSAWLAVEFGRRLGGSAGKNGVLCVSLHPGFVLSELQRHFPAPAKLVVGLVFKHAVYGAYSELYAAFSPDVTDRDNGGYLLAWGRKGILPPFVAVEIKGGKMEKFVGWCERECGSFL